MTDDLERYSRSAIAARLKKARQGRFSTAAELARAVGMKEVTVRAHENGQNGVSMSNARKYARALGFTAEWLLYGRSEGDGVSPEMDRMDWSGYRLAEVGAETVMRPVPVWQDAKENAFLRVPAYDHSLAEGFLSLRVTGHEILDVDAFKVADDHASLCYPQGTYVISARPNLMDIRHGDHAVTVRILPNGVLTETTIRSAKLIDGELAFTSLRPGESERVTGRLSEFRRLDVLVGMGIQTRHSIADTLKTFIKDVSAALVDPDVTSTRLESEARELAEAGRDWEAQKKILKSVGDETTRLGTEPRFVNLTDREIIAVIGVVMASYTPRDRSGATIAKWDREGRRIVVDDDPHNFENTYRYRPS